MHNKLLFDNLKNILNPFPYMFYDRWFSQEFDYRILFDQISENILTNIWNLIKNLFI